MAGYEEWSRKVLVQEFIDTRKELFERYQQEKQIENEKYRNPNRIGPDDPYKRR